MATDIAVLGLGVDSKPVAQASTELTKFAGSAKTAEAAAKGFTGVSTQATSATRQLADSINRAQVQADALTRIQAIGARQAALSSHAMSNLAFQINDVATMAAMGSDPLRILATQAGQFYQVLAMGEGGVRGSLGYLRDTVLGLVTPFRLVTAGALSFAGASAVAVNSWVNAQNEIRLALMGVGGAAGITVADINRIAFAAADARQATVGEARQMALAFASTGRIGADIASQAVSIGRNLSRVFGEDASESAQRLAKALVDPAKGLDDINKRLGAFDDKTAQHILRLAAQNRQHEYQQIILDRVKNSTDGASSATNSWAKAYQYLIDTASKWWALSGQRVNVEFFGGGDAQERLNKAFAEHQKLVEANERAWTDWQRQMNQVGINRKTEEMMRLAFELVEVERKAKAAGDALEAVRIGDLARGRDPSASQLHQLEDIIVKIQNAMADRDVMAVMDDVTKRTLQRVLDTSKLSKQYYATSSQLAVEEHDFEMRRISARSVATQAQIAYEETLARLRRGGTTTEKEALDQAGMVRAKMLAQASEDIARSNQMQLLSARQRVEYAGLELGLIGRTNTEMEIARGLMQAKQQAQQEALRLGAKEGEYDQAHVAALGKQIELEARRNQLARERQFMLDLQFERDQMARTPGEQQVYSQLRQLGVLTNGEIQDAGAQAFATQIRLSNILRTNMEMSREFTGSLVRDLMSGTNATEALANALSRLADRFADLALDHAFQAMFGGKGGVNSMISGMFGGGGSAPITSGWGATVVQAFHNGGVVGAANDNQMYRTVNPSVFAGARRYHGGGIAGLSPGEVPAILKRGEIVLPEGGAGGAGSVSVPISIAIDASGADPAAIARLESMITGLQQQLPSQIVATIRQARDRGVA